MNLQDLHPRSVDEAIELLFDNLTEEDVFAIRQSGASQHHFGFGMALRNAWIHPDPAGELVKSCLDTFGVSMADDISGLIMSGLFARVKSEEIDLFAQAEGYRQHWIEAGCDPATGQPL